MRMRDVGTKVTCMGSKLIDTSNWMNSMILVKTQQAQPVCPAGSPPGLIQPPPPNVQGIDPKVPPLSADEKRCVVEYIKAAAAR
jgi:hypothetical protein